MKTLTFLSALACISSLATSALSQTYQFTYHINSTTASANTTQVLDVPASDGVIDIAENGTVQIPQFQSYTFINTCAFGNFSGGGTSNRGATVDGVSKTGNLNQSMNFVLCSGGSASLGTSQPITWTPDVGGGDRKLLTLVIGSSSSSSTGWMPGTFTLAEANDNPIAVIQGAPAYFFRGGTLTLDGSESRDVDVAGSITGLHWDVDNDGQFDDGTGPVLTVLPGSYPASWTAGSNATIRLRATDNSGATHIATITRLVDPTGAVAPDSVLDLTFNGTGTAVTPIGSSHEYGRGVAVQSDGKILVAGESYNGSNYDFALVRYTEAGVLDTTFGTGGKVTTAIGSSSDIAFALALQDDGGIVLAGYSYNGSNNDVALARYTATGALDTTFGVGGKVTTQIGSGEDIARGVAVQSDGKIVVAGYTYNGSNEDVAVLRYNNNGTLDTSFGTAGKVTTPIGGSTADLGRQLTIQSDGKLLVVGNSHNGSNNDVILLRYTTSGALDTTFATGGKAVTAIGTDDDYGFDVAEQSDGKLVVAGSTKTAGLYDFAFVRYTATGLLDTSFDGDGKASFAMGSAGGNDHAYGVAVQSDGKIIAAGAASNGANNDFALLRLTSSGVLDPLFGQNGRLTQSFGSGEDVAYSMALQADGRFVVAGYTNNGSNDDIAIARYWIDRVPAVVTTGVTALGGTSVTLNGSVNPNGNATTAEFHYGLTTSYGSTVSAPIPQPSGTLPQNVSAQLTNLTPGTTYHYRLTASNVFDDVAGDDMTFTTLNDDAVLMGLTLNVGDLSPPFASNVFSYSATVASNVSSVTITPTLSDPAASFTVNGAPNGPIPLSFGNNIITVLVTAEDGTTTLAYSVTITRLSDPLFTTLHSKGGAVPNAGVVGSGIPAGAIWSKLGVPSINDAGHLAVLGDWAAGTVRGSSIFRGGPGAVTLQISLSKGTAVPGLTNVVLGTLKDPILGPDGSIAVVAGLANAPSTTGAVTTADNAALVLDADGSGAGGAVVIARKGTAAPGAGGALWKTFDSVAVGNNAVAILGKLSGAGIGTGNDQCLWIYNRNTMTTTLALREGNTLMGSTVKVLGALVARAAAGAQGRGVENDGAQDQVAARVTLANNSVLVLAINDDGSVLTLGYQTGNGVADFGTGATWKSFGLPGQNTVTALTFLGTVQGGTATTANNVALFTEDDSSFALSKRVTKGDAAPGFPGGVFGGFKDPVLGTGGAFAFVGSTAVSSSAGIASTSNDGVWHHDGSTLSLIARESTHPAGTATGTNWKAFTSVALPNGRKPLFYATLVVGPGGVTTASDTGIWAVDSLGQVKKLIQEGGTFGSSTVKSFKALLPLTGSPAQTRSFNNNGEVVMQVTDAAGGTHLLHVAVP
ncbi:MAG: cadherin-like beta sandwich domain-containing protein [Verrucomicrobiaceae bacterium]|nr:cadherin-like beta sandwich domain-containing protein [Verrucomicrobiaceae bacterium]